MVIAVAAADDALSESFRQSAALVCGIEWAKEWANRPANHATPRQLAEAAQSLAKGKIECTILGPKQVAKLGMGAFLAVAQGSQEPLRFIELRYDGAAKGEPPVVLVGKGITFDTGGISIKPAPEMDEMKFDMCGAASVLGVFRTLSELKPKINVVGLIPACENMPGGKAVKPGDVVTSMSGQTIEILNTDAEGRLVLCDALAYAARFKPRAVVDIATLTGACVIALGGVRSGLFSSSDALAEALLAAGESSLDLCWRLHDGGWRLRYDPVAHVAHDHRTGMREVLGRRRFYGTGAAYLADRHETLAAPMVKAQWASVDELRRSLPLVAKALSQIIAERRRQGVAAGRAAGRSGAARDPARRRLVQRRGARRRGLLARRPDRDSAGRAGRRCRPAQVHTGGRVAAGVAAVGTSESEERGYEEERKAGHERHGIRLQHRPYVRRPASINRPLRASGGPGGAIWWDELRKHLHMKRTCEQCWPAARAQDRSGVGPGRRSRGAPDAGRGRRGSRRRGRARRRRAPRWRTWRRAAMQADADQRGADRCGHGRGEQVSAGAAGWPREVIAVDAAGPGVMS